MDVMQRVRAAVRTLVFDFDGTLVTCPYDFPQMRRVVVETAGSYGLQAADLGRDAGLLEMVEQGAAALVDPLQATSFRDTALANLRALEYEAAAYTVLLPGVVDALTALRAGGYRLGIITRNSSAAVARIIGTTDLPVEYILSREAVERPKPHPEHVERMLRLLASTPATALMVGDHPMDIAVGKAAGMYTAAVLTGQTDAVTLRAAAPDLLLSSVVELAGVLLQTPLAV
jgi:phosphoglycolate phosphatase